MSVLLKGIKYKIYKLYRDKTNNEANVVKKKVNTWGV